jgi:hypothetical protein
MIEELWYTIIMNSGIIFCSHCITSFDIYKNETCDCGMDYYCIPQNTIDKSIVFRNNTLLLTSDMKQGSLYNSESQVKWLIS